MLEEKERACKESDAYTQYVEQNSLLEQILLFLVTQCQEGQSSGAEVCILGGVVGSSMTPTFKPFVLTLIQAQFDRGFEFGWWKCRPINEGGKEQQFLGKKFNLYPLKSALDDPIEVKLIRWSFGFERYQTLVCFSLADSLQKRNLLNF